MSFCRSQKKKRGSSEERTASVALILMTALATALVQAAGRVAGKVPALEDAAAAALMEEAVLAQVTSCWQSSSMKCAGGYEDTGNGLGKGRVGDGESSTMELCAITKPVIEHVIPPKPGLQIFPCSKITRPRVPLTHRRHTFLAQNAHRNSKKHAQSHAESQDHQN